MSILVGWGPEARGRSGLELARTMAESAELPLVVCCVIPDRWGPVGMARAVDADYEAHLHGLAEDALAEARAHLSDAGCEVTYHVRTHRSVPGGLLAAAEDHEALALVAGSSSHGAWGHIALGSVTDRLLHSSTRPVAIAPRGWRSPPTVRVRRITVAVDGTPASQAVLERAADVAAWVGASLRLVTFAVRAGRAVTAGVGDVEERVVAAWRADAEAEIDRALAEVELAGSAREAERLVVEARSWADVLDLPGWADGDVLVVGSSDQESALRRVFLGSTATRIIRHSPVPVVVVP